MSRYDKGKQKSGGVIKFAAVGMCVGIAMLMILILIMSFAVEDRKLPEDMMKISALAACFLSTITGSASAVKLNRKTTGIPVGVITALMIMLALLCIAAFIGDGYVFNKMTPVAAAAMLVGGIIGGTAASGRGKKRK